MNKDDTEAKSCVQVDGSLYTTTNYCSPGRFAAYAYQVREILDCKAQKVLEIGPGNGVVTYVLRKAGIHVDTLDHDAELKPDFVASILALPFAPNSYDAIICCQVLEHLPWEQFRKAMECLSSITKNIIVLSLPHTSYYYFVSLQLPIIGRRSISFDIKENAPMKFNGEHYWEIGMGVSEKKVLSIFKLLNLKIVKSYRIPEYRYHHMFCLSK